jgi:hypothetical protein
MDLSKFKVGDKIRLVGECWGNDIPEICTIDTIDGDVVYFKEHTSELGWCIDHGWDIELVVNDQHEHTFSEINEKLDKILVLLDEIS